MHYQNRDTRIKHIFTRKNHTCYGMGIGIMILDDVYPGFPGDVHMWQAIQASPIVVCAVLE